MSNNVKTWAHSLFAAAIGGAASSLGSIFVAPETFNFSHAGLIKILQVALFGAVVPVLMLLKQSPLPPLDETDPGQKPTDNGQTKKLGVLMLCALLLPASIPMVGCTPVQVNQAVNQISAYLPTVLSLLNEAITIYNAVSVKQTNPEAARALADIQTTLASLQRPLNDYLSATSSSSKSTAWANVEALVDTAVKDADTLLAAAHVKDPQTAATGTIIIGSLDAAIHVLDAFVIGAQTKAQVQAKLARRTVKISALDQAWTPQAKEVIAKGVNAPYPVVLQQAESLGF